MRAASILAQLPASTIRLGLDRIQRACDALGRPQGAFPSVHVAGTNGKGSTCAFLAAALAASGRRVGLYTSPHLVSFSERIRVGAAPVDEATLDAAMSRLVAAWPALLQPENPDCLTYFEAATALAFVIFAEAAVDVAVLEVGLGGRLDATNVEGKDLLAAVVSRVALDHGEFLGSDLVGVAREKGGIARQGVPLVVGMQQPAARQALLEQGARVGAEVVDVEATTELRREPGGLQYVGSRWRLEDLRLGLLGDYQEENARLALATLELLRVPSVAAREGLAAARWPGRLQVVSERPLVVVDGAHNPEGAQALAAAYQRLWPGRRPSLVFGVVGDKDRRPMMEALFPLARAIHLAPPAIDRAAAPEVLAAEATGAGLAGAAGAAGLAGSAGSAAVSIHRSVAEALDAALRLEGEAGAVLVCGSLYVVGEALAALGAV